jgi:ketosteroid isomerase-like protein
MTNAMKSNLERDGELRSFAGHGHATLGSAGGISLLRGVFEPGWRWSVDVAPLAGTPTCHTRHLGFMLSGQMEGRLDDGTEFRVEAGDLFDLPAGHDAWVVGDKAAVMLDYSPDATRYAQKGAATGEDPAMDLVRRGYEAFNTGDVDALRGIFARDVVQNVPGAGPFAGTYKGADAVLGYYGKLAEATDGSFRAIPTELHGDGHGHVTAVHQMVASRNGNTRVSRGSILFTVVGGKVTDLLELHADLAGDDAFFA